MKTGRTMAWQVTGRGKPDPVAGPAVRCHDASCTGHGQVLSSTVVGELADGSRAAAHSGIQGLTKHSWAAG